MWQRFSQEARLAVFHAQEEAKRYGQTDVGPEHFLLGLTRNPESAAMLALVALGVSPDLVREELEKRLTSAETIHPSDMTLTPEGKQVINDAYTEGQKLKHRYIGTEHLLLGLVLNQGIAGRTLGTLRVEIGAMRRHIATCAPPKPAPRRLPRVLDALCQWLRIGPHRGKHI